MDNQPDSTIGSEIKVESGDKRIIWIGGIISLILATIMIVAYMGLRNGNESLADLSQGLGTLISSLGFVWLILGFYNQMRQISLQFKELKDSTEAQKAQATALMEQNAALRATATAIKDSFTPYVSVYLDHDHTDVYLYVVNYGNRSAFNLKLQFDPGLSEIALGVMDAEIDNILEIPMLAPGQMFYESITYNIALMHKFKEKLFTQNFNVEIDYVDDCGKIIKQVASPSLRLAPNAVAKRRAPSTSLHEIVDALGDPHIGTYKNMRVSLDSISKSLEAMSRR